MDDVFKALADASRRTLLDRLHGEPGQTLGELCQGLGMSRQAVSKHLAILEDANLVATVWRGREKLHYVNPVPIHEIADRWIGKYQRAPLEALAALKTQLEDEMDKPRFVYVTYIKSTRERVFQALTDGTIVPEYWFGFRIESDWKVGGPLRFYNPKGELVHDDKLLKYDPPAELSYSWHPLMLGFDKEPPSRVTFTLEDVDGQVKLTLVHDEFPTDSVVLKAVSNGWPAVLSGLKSWAEIGASSTLKPPQLPKVS